MANTYMRNKASGEIREVELDSQEFYNLQGEVTALGQPMWEQTNIAHADAIRDRAAAGELYEEDLGFEAQDELRYEALKLASEGVAPEVNPHLFLTPGEIEAGLTPEQKQSDLQDMYNQKVGRRSEIYAKSADMLAGDREREDRDHVRQGGVLSALAGGSDDRDDAPSRGASAASGGGDGSRVQPSTGSPAGSSQPPSSRSQQSKGTQGAQSSQGAQGSPAAPSKEGGE